MNYFDENKILKMVKESDSQLVNVSWYQAMQGHYLKTDGTKSEDKSFSFVVIRDFLWKIREYPSFDIVVNLMKDEFSHNLIKNNLCYVDLNEKLCGGDMYGLTLGDIVCKYIDSIVKRVNYERELSKLSKSLTALSSEKPTEEVHNENDAEADSSIANGFAALPEKFQNEPTKRLFDKLIENKWLNEDLTAPENLEGQRSYIFREICKTLGIRNCWKESSKFTGKNGDSMRQGCEGFEKSKKFSDFNKIFERLLRYYYRDLKNSGLAPRKRRK